MNQKPSHHTFTLIAYLLVLVGYMTLTISLPLVGLHTVKLPSSSKNFELGLSALFFLFSLSAICLSRIADMIGAYRVLGIAQPVSIIGLIITGSATSNWALFLGLCLMGAGTGCYSSIARLLIAKHTPNHQTMRKAFVWFSIILIIAPLLSSYLTIYSIHFISWRLGYFLMALIELMVLLTVMSKLRKTTTTTKVSAKEILRGYLYCLKQPYYALNMLLIGLSLTLIVSILIGYSHQLFALELHLTGIYFNLAGIGIIATYVIGILGFRVLPKRFSIEIARLIATLLLLLAAGWLYFANSTTAILLAIYCASFGLGVLSPLTTSAGLLVIKKHHGAAAALYTFCFAIISSLWSSIHAHLNISTSQYIDLALAIIGALMLALWLFTFSQSKKIGS